jgi:PAS domain-containing protein/anti-sigma regulatory factor (Ser/Thr protein kinase)
MRCPEGSFRVLFIRDKSSSQSGASDSREISRLTERDHKDQQDRQDRQDRQEEQYRTLLAAMDVGFCIIEMLFDAHGQPRDYRFIEFNPAFERHTGLRDARNRTARELVPGLDEFWFRTYGNVALTGEPVRFQNQAPAMGRSFDVYALRIGPADERRVGLLFTDISESVRAAEALQTKTDEVTSILESVTEAFFALDGDWRFTYVNAEAERVLSRRREELLGRSLWDEFPAAVGSEFETQYRRAARDRVTVSFQPYYPPPLDAWYDVRAYPSVDGPGISVYFRSINEQRRREQERERLLREQGRLLAELREASVRQRRFLREMLAGFTEGRLRLCFAREEMPAPLSPLSDTFTLAKPALHLFRKQLEAVAEGLRFPKERLRDLLTASHEAAMNAVRHGGGGTARIHGDSETGTIQVWIEDRGPGIAEEMIHRAVEQGWTTGGFGQGFFYMQSCADHLYLFSVANEGTTALLEMDRLPPQPGWLPPLTS